MCAKEELPLQMSTYDWHTRSGVHQDTCALYVLSSSCALLWIMMLCQIVGRGSLAWLAHPCRALLTVFSLQIASLLLAVICLSVPGCPCSVGQQHHAHPSPCEYYAPSPHDYGSMFCNAPKKSASIILYTCSQTSAGSIAPYLLIRCMIPPLTTRVHVLILGC